MMGLGEGVEILMWGWGNQNIFLVMKQAVDPVRLVFLQHIYFSFPLHFVNY